MAWSRRRRRGTAVGEECRRCCTIRVVEVKQLAFRKEDGIWRTVRGWGISRQAPLAFRMRFCFAWTKLVALHYVGSKRRRSGLRAICGSCTLKTCQSVKTCFGSSALRSHVDMRGIWLSCSCICMVSGPNSHPAGHKRAHASMVCMARTYACMART